MRPVGSSEIGAKTRAVALQFAISNDIVTATSNNLYSRTACSTPRDAKRCEAGPDDDCTLMRARRSACINVALIQLFSAYPLVYGKEKRTGSIAKWAPASAGAAWTALASAQALKTLLSFILIVDMIRS
jgi:hypothetical protein